MKRREVKAARCGAAAFALLGASLCATLSAARADAPVKLHASTLLEPPDVLARYAKSLAGVKTPKSVSFEFSVEQSGLRDLEQSHRVYRAGLNERDETISADGYTLASPSVRIFTNRINHYDIRAVAPRTSQYDFIFAGLARSGGHIAYIFHTKRRSAASYAATEVVIDGAAFLPVSIAFSLRSAAAKGTGALTFAPAFDPPLAYWLVRSASVSVDVAGKPARERIAFSKYAFPQLPKSTFERRRALTKTAEPGDLDAP